MAGEALNQSDEEYTTVFMGALSNLNPPVSALVNPKNKLIFKSIHIHKTLIHPIVLKGKLIL